MCDGVLRWLLARVLVDKTMMISARLSTDLIDNGRIVCRQLLRHTTPRALRTAAIGRWWAYLSSGCEAGERAGLSHQLQWCMDLPYALFAVFVIVIICDAVIMWTICDTSKLLSPLH